MNHKEHFDRHGFALVQGLYSADEAASLRDHYMNIRERGAFSGDMGELGPASSDPLLRYPRMINMHRSDESSLEWLLSDRITSHVARFLDEEPFAVQTMLYFKPAGARGQALHQDQYYLRAAPGTCVAAWMALDEIDEANGCLQVVSGSHRLPLLCVEQADTTQSFTDASVSLPDGLAAEPVVMSPGDVLFFHGQLIHGSYPNVTPDRFRRALIAHYINGSAEKIADYYFPLLRMDGSEVRLVDNAPGGPCGRFVDRDGHPIVEMTHAA